jgi:N-acetylneuraminic acid mutarotase
MMTNRHGATSTLLLDGRVLITGGVTSSTTVSNEGLNTAELYDPVTGAFALTGSMKVARNRHSASLLSDGKVLVAGGSADDSAELYDPATGTFAQTGQMLDSVSWQTATTLIDGRVLLAGGQNNHGYVAKAEIYDPTTGTFVRTGPMYAAREDAAATLLQDGRVLITGGDQGQECGECGDPGVYLNSAEIYSPKSGKFTRTGSLAQKRDDATAILLRDGQVLVTGGYNSKDGSLTTAELYNPSTAKWTKTGSMVVRRSGSAAALLADGRVLISGGTADDPAAELYIPTTGKFAAAGSVVGYDIEVRLQDGRVLLPGIPSELYWP